MESYVGRVVDKAFDQCGKTTDFLSQISSLEENTLIINVVAVPNCSKSIVAQMFCSTCSTHIVSETDLSSLDNLYQWFTNLARQYSREIESSPLDISAHHNLVGRIVGAASLVDLRTVHESISWTHDQISEYEMMEKLIKKRWCQLSPKQHSIIASDPQFLWLTGPSGTGKTIVALWKAVEILKGSTQAGASPSKSGSVLYIIIEIGGTQLKNYYSSKLEGVPRENCELIIKEAKEFKLLGELSDRKTDIQKFPLFVHSLQKENPGKMVHIIYDDCYMTTFLLDKSRFIHDLIKLVDMNLLGNVWCIQDSFLNLVDIAEDIPGFQRTHLEKVMRMSLQNIEIANTLLFRDLKSPLKPGHAISGQRPIVYRMKCVCIYHLKTTSRVFIAMFSELHG
ncbi:hypothetical protein HOLleu_04559 [Holothuria leucospilota]|uniref:Uncharacterized protein n=1 Tax=Holothuria leucospilota TaxID=206669 RepID=A0A9Q1CTZ1_HOLLE|nr:hypothetical protein HOLleu_04559 [Holothuria leucospilota]